MTKRIGAKIANRDGRAETGCRSSTMTWEQVGLTADGWPRIKLRSTLKLRMRPISRSWRSDGKSAREMARRRAGRLKGKFAEGGEKKDAGPVPVGERRVIENVE